MNRRRVVRFQVLLLLILTLLVMLRACGGTSRPEGVVSITDVGEFSLHEAAFRVDSAAALHITATGSIESRNASADDPLAAYGWIIDASTREPVWVMTRNRTTRGNGMLVHADTTVLFNRGAYHAFFAAYGNDLRGGHRRSFFQRIFNERSHWMNDEDHWRLIVRAEDDARGHVERVATDAIADTGSVLWSSGPVRNRATTERLLNVRAPVRARVYAIGEVGDEPLDYGWIRREDQGELIWRLNGDNTVHAGGSAANRLFRGEVELQPGIHAVGYRTDAGHAFRSWRANPPFDPYGWGLRLELVDQRDSIHVSRFDPWAEYEPALSIVGVGNDEHRKVRFSLPEPALVIVDATGEIGRSRYDYGTLRSVDADSVVWEMTDERARPAGGHRNNRHETAFLNLAPGRYQLEFRTDASHAYGDWRNGEPDHPERWGVTLFRPDGAPLEDVEVIEQEQDASDVEEAVAPAPPATPEPPGPHLVSIRRVGNDRTEQQTFELAERSYIHIRAVGELSVSNRHDYAWIENEDGTVVWEMTYGNTTHAGGSARNRQFNGALELSPGRYVAYFQTDFSHAYGDFRSEAETPDDPEAWGIVIRRQP